MTNLVQQWLINNLKNQPHEFLAKLVHVYISLLCMCVSGG